MMKNTVKLYNPFTGAGKEKKKKRKKENLNQNEASYVKVFVNCVEPKSVKTTNPNVINTLEIENYAMRRQYS